MKDIGVLGLIVLVYVLLYLKIEFFGFISCKCCEILERDSVCVF